MPGCSVAHNGRHPLGAVDRLAAQHPTELARQRCGLLLIGALGLLGNGARAEPLTNPDASLPATGLLEQRLEASALEAEALRKQLNPLQERTAALEATRFSPTTRLHGTVRTVLGGLDYKGSGLSAWQGDSPLPPLPEAATFNVDLRLNLDTSFSGADLLRLQLRGTTFSEGPWGRPPTIVSTLASSFGGKPEGQLELYRAYYRLPLSSSLSFTAGARLDQYDLLPLFPNSQAADRILAFFQLNGAVGAYNLASGWGAGLSWRQRPKGQPGLVLGAGYLQSNSSLPSGRPSDAILPPQASSTSVQLGYVGSGWSLTAIYSRNSQGTLIGGTQLQLQLNPSDAPGNAGWSDALGLSFNWQPRGSRWLPAMVLGAGLNQFTYPSQRGPGGPVPAASAQSLSWSSTFQWAMVPWPNTTLGLGIGQPTFITRADGALLQRRAPAALGDDGRYAGGDGKSFAIELYLKTVLTDHITITPTIIWLQQPRGLLTPERTGGGTISFRGGLLNGLALLVQATFRF